MQKLAYWASLFWAGSAGRLCRSHRARLRRRGYRRAALEHCTALRAVGLPYPELCLAAANVRLKADEQIVLAAHGEHVADHSLCPDEGLATSRPPDSSDAVRRGFRLRDQVFLWLSLACRKSTHLSAHYSNTE